jgi:hypothetical protein
MAARKSSGLDLAKFPWADGAAKGNAHGFSQKIVFGDLVFFVHNRRFKQDYQMAENQKPIAAIRALAQNGISGRCRAQGISRFTVWTEKMSGAHFYSPPWVFPTGYVFRVRSAKHYTL